MTNYTHLLSHSLSSHTHLLIGQLMGRTGCGCVQVQDWAGVSRGRFPVANSAPSIKAPEASPATFVPGNACVQKIGLCGAEFLLWEELRLNTVLLARVKWPRVRSALLSKF
jgi:hypothetical protein